jgi:hypothetical protein
MSDDDPASDHSANPKRSLKGEWRLFWNSLSQEARARVPSDFHEKPEGKFSYIGKLSLHELRTLGRMLSQERRLTYLKLEKLHNEIESQRLKIETLQLVGSATESAQDRYHELLSQGELINDKLRDLDNQILLARKAQTLAATPDPEVE